MENVQVKNLDLMMNLTMEKIINKVKTKAERVVFLQKLSKGNNVIMKVEYYCNNCNRYFEGESLGLGNPACPYCGSDNVSDF